MSPEILDRREIPRDPQADRRILQALDEAGFIMCGVAIFDCGFAYGVAAKCPETGKRTAVRFRARPEPEEVVEKFTAWRAGLSDGSVPQCLS